MPPLVLEGDTLGEKHKHFNKLVQDAVFNQQISLSKINYDDGDLQNLLKIHTASKTKNAEYIIEVLKCEDMLYVSTAIKQCTWLITDQQYAHIVNPHYLHAELFPHMLTKAANKLLLHIRLHLKDENRVEAFYTYFKDKLNKNDAMKWLLNGSKVFIDDVLQDADAIPCEIFKRLCKRSIKFLPYYIKVEPLYGVLQTVPFLLQSNIEEYLNFLDAIDDRYHLPKFGKRHTEIIMKKYPERILDKFDIYISKVDLSIVAKYIKKEDIKAFILKYASNDNTNNHINNLQNLKHFIKNIPTEDRFEFVKNVYIEKTETALSSVAVDHIPSYCINTYEWYQYAPFDIAMIELKKLIRAVNSPAERCDMLSILITCARKNSQHARTLLEYYYEKHRNEPFKFKIKFINNIVTKMSTHEFDTKTWKALDTLFRSLEVYLETDHDVQLCLQSIIVYKVLHNEDVPEVIEKKIKFDTFAQFQRKLNVKQRDQLFLYLITCISNKLNIETIETEIDFNNCIKLLNNALNLIKCWKKDIKDHTFIRHKIQDLIKIKKQNSWQTSLSILYDSNKSFCRHFFEESVTLCPSEKVCLNALKHKPQLLECYDEEVNALRTDDTVELRHLLTKLRVYWPCTLAQHWTAAYLNNFNNSTGHRALIRGLIALLPQKQLMDLVQKHVPKDAIIDWCEIKEMELNVCKNIAKSLYIARPMISLDVLLQYAKGDYLQYAVPSLNAILHNISRAQSCIYIPKLLEAPVSLQKYGLHLAYMKLEHVELKSLFSNIWQTTKNSTIRTHLFIHTYNLLCKVTEPSLAKDLWEVLDVFIGNLTGNENKDIYSKLGKAEKIHICVRGEFFMKSYTFLESLQSTTVNCETQKNDLLGYAPSIMDLLDADFVAEKILIPNEKKISDLNSNFTDLMSSYVLHGKTEGEQCERYEKIVVPALEQALASWDLVHDDTYVMKHFVDTLLQVLTWDAIRYLTVKRIVVPVKLFSELKAFMEQKMPIVENYTRYTNWKLITEYMKLLAEHKDILRDTRLDKISMADVANRWVPTEVEHVWRDIHFKLAPQFAVSIVNYLKEDIDKYYPTIYWLFKESLSNTHIYLTYNAYGCRSIITLETMKQVLLVEDYVPSYLIACEEFVAYGDEEEMKKQSEIRKMLLAHPSQEVQMHYYTAYKVKPDKFQ